MSRNGSGTYSLPAGNPVVTGTTYKIINLGNPTLAQDAVTLNFLQAGTYSIDGGTF